MSLLQRLVWVVLPAQRYLDQRSPFRGAPPGTGSSGPMPYVPLGDPLPTEEVVAAWRAEPDLQEDIGTWTEEDEAETAAHDAEVERCLPLARTLARQVVESGQIRHAGGGRVVEARLVRFWRGRSVLEASCSRPDGSSSGCQCVVPRGRGEDAVEQVAFQLAHQLAG